MTEEDRRKKDCISKGCSYYLKKEKNCTFSNDLFNFEDKSIEIMNCLLDMTKEEASIEIVGVSYSSFYQYTIRYVSITNESVLDKYLEIIKAKFQCDFKIKLLAYDFDTCAKIISKKWM